MMQLKGRYPAPPGAPQDIPGLELAGEVVECGPGVQRFEPGDRVMSIVAGGGQAELAVVHERTAMPVPEELEWDAAGGVPEVFTTAHDALFTQAGLRAGERLLVHGGAGGVGMAAVQLGQMAGARVTATVRNPDLRERIDALDVHAIEPEGFEEHGPFDVILELVGAPNMPGNLAALAVGGRIAVIGIGAGAKAELNLGALMGKRGAHPRLDAARAPARGQGRDRAPRRALRAARLRLRRPQRAGCATYPLDAVADAYERFQAGGKLGKIVLTALSGLVAGLVELQRLSAVHGAQVRPAVLQRELDLALRQPSPALLAPLARRTPASAPRGPWPECKDPLSADVRLNH